MPKPRGVLHVPLVPIPEDTLDDAVDAELRNGAGPSGYGLEAEEDYVRERRGPWATFFQRGSDVESARVNHHYTREERGRLNAVEGVDYFSPNSEVYREWLRSQPHRRTWDRWLMMGTIGAFTGFVGYCLYLAINYVSMAKHQIFWRFTAGLSWFLNTSMSVGLAFCAAWTVVFVAPAAAGSGVPEVMAFLNGLNIPKVFNIRTFLVKLVSTCLAVSSGLPVGPEGPMIHIGAAIGAGLSQTHSTTLGLDLEVFERFRNPKDKRDFVTAGAAVGAAVAFEAPIGGLLFAFEEVASFWQQSLCWQIFFACVCSILSLGLLRSAEKALGGEGHFGLFESTTLFEVKNSLLKTHIVMVIPAVVIGVICGLVGIVFTVMNLKVSRLRDELMKERKWWRVWEPCILAFIFVTGTVVLPMFFPCLEAHCFINEQVGLSFSSTLAGCWPVQCSQ
ncbi:unnamed protein product [Ostreobium quekettii]|uniref:Chloride channel protein n=1 Tax=Ostreobium quekettii TaxID=121088 RepID=A0A8S1IUI0_9CHLO|nr:unnamed protein product [Ostreobium quekettii]